MELINIAIDGPAGAGKGITSKLLAKKLNYNYLDTGAMYRAVSYYFNSKNISAENVTLENLKEIVLNFDKKNEICLNGENIEEQIRTPQVGKFVSIYARIPEVRKYLTIMQKEIVKNKSYVAEGRDIGHSVIPDAELKIYLTASIDARTKRRVKDFNKKGIDANYEEIYEDIRKRDESDMTNPISPLKKLDDAVEVDTSDLTIDEQVDKIYQLAKKIINR